MKIGKRSLGLSTVLRQKQTPPILWTPFIYVFAINGTDNRSNIGDPLSIFLPQMRSDSFTVRPTGRNQRTHTHTHTTYHVTKETALPFATITGALPHHHHYPPRWRCLSARGCLAGVNSGKWCGPPELLHTRAGVPWQHLTAHLFKSHPGISLKFMARWESEGEIRTFFFSFRFFFRVCFSSPVKAKTTTLASPKVWSCGVLSMHPSIHASIHPCIHPSYQLKHY